MRRAIVGDEGTIERRDATGSREPPARGGILKEVCGHVAGTVSDREKLTMA